MRKVGEVGMNNEEWCKKNCPYSTDCACDGVCNFVLSLLKEQEAVKRTYRTGINGFRMIWTCGACGSDLHPNNAKAKYCSNCGQAVKWE